jgi:uncharacterized repeat protein (TIGR03803 family)
VAVFVVTAVGARAQDLTTLFSFNGADGAGPYLGSLIQATNGQFYGTTEGGGANSEGTVFEISPSGSFAMVYSFGYPNLYPQSGLVQASDGNFYGATYAGAGGSDLGTVYRITPKGQLTTLYRFCVSEQANRFLREHYVAEFNRRFQVAAAQRGTAFVPCRRQDLERVFSVQSERAVNRDNTVSFQNHALQRERVGWKAMLAGCQVTCISIWTAR